MKMLRYFLEYLFLLIASAGFRRLPRRMALTAAGYLADITYFLVPVRKKTVLRNLTRSFPEKTYPDIHHIARKVYQNFSKTVVDHLRLPAINHSDLLKIVRFKGEENLVAALAKGRGIILIGGHFGNWEYMLAALAAAGYPVNVVTADINNPFINRLVRNNRIKAGAHLLPKKGALAKITTILKDNGIIALLIDQDARNRGVFVEFLGRPASTVKGPARLVLSLGATLLFAIPETNADLSITVTIQTIDTKAFTSLIPNDITALTQLCTRTLEAYVRRFPEQWFWLHRRWKTRPQGEVVLSPEYRKHSQPGQRR